MKDIEFAPALTKHNAQMDTLKQQERTALQQFWNHVNPALTGKITPDDAWLVKRNEIFQMWHAAKTLQLKEMEALLLKCI